MSMSSSRSLLLAAVVSAISAFDSAAFAASVEYQGSCFRSARIEQWTPQKGPPARFIVDTFLADTSTGLWIGLGRSGTSFWSAEGGDVNDACDDCRVLRLVETRADGTRKRYDLWGHDASDKIGADVAAEKAYILKRLWTLAAGPWPADKLTQDYSMKLGRPDAPNASSKDIFAVAVQKKNTLNLRYDLTSSLDMCWCVYDWKSQVAP